MNKTIFSERTCEPGEKFELTDLSTCICGDDGYTANCTLGILGLSRNLLIDNTSPYCTPGQLFSPDNCNVCNCSSDGSTAMCRLKVCMNVRDHDYEESLFRLMGEYIFQSHELYS